MKRKPIRVAVFADSAIGDRTGIGNYTSHLLSGLSSVPEVELIEILPHQGMELQHRNAEYPRCGPFRRSVYSWYPCSMWQLGNRQDLNIIHNPAQVPGFFQTQVPQVLTIHDLVPLIYPKESKKSRTLVYRLLLGASIRAAGRIITVSENTKKDVIKRFGISDSKVVVIPLAANSSYRPQATEDDKEVLKCLGIKEPYILYVGTIEGRKNVDLLLKAFSSLLDQGFQHSLVLAGKRGWRTARFDRALSGFKDRSRVQLTGYVDDNALPVLYRHADVFAYPSLYEGFGLPPLEAMACGTPVVCSSSSSLPEVVGDAGILVKPGDADMLAQTLAQVLSSVNLRESLSLRGRERASKFSWKKMVESTVSVYKDVAKENLLQGSQI